MRSIVDMKRHIQKHMKDHAPPGYENFWDRVKVIASELSDDDGYCVLCNQPQETYHFHYYHLSRKYLEPALGGESSENSEKSRRIKQNIKIEQP